MINIKWFSRKLVAALVLFVTSTTFVFLDKATFGEWATFMVFVYTIYGGGNAVDKYLKARGDSPPIEVNANTVDATVINQ